jgi:hypothetical protein
LKEERRLRVFENRVLRGIFGPERDEVTGEWRKLHNEELNDLYCSKNIVRVKVSLMRGRETCIDLWWENMRERDHWGDPGVNGRITLGWIFRKGHVGLWTGFGWLRIETDGGQL